MGCEQAPPVSCCGVRRMSSATERLRPSPTPATRSGRCGVAVPHDNALTENFFLILKTECIQNKNGVAPLTLRHSA